MTPADVYLGCRALSSTLLAVNDKEIVSKRNCRSTLSPDPSRGHESISHPGPKQCDAYGAGLCRFFIYKQFRVPPKPMFNYFRLQDMCAKFSWLLQDNYICTKYHQWLGGRLSP